MDNNSNAWALDVEDRLTKIETAIAELTKIVDALGPVVTELLLAHKEAEREKVEGPPSIVSIADEEGDPWVTQ